ncbi:hypothetical protein NIES3806_35020 [Microcystis aeruginosa NIES-3806]|jgi:hypothetical protein|uniref:hypothetical protein n=1 Tax=Microcystis aeruginosa TaxID=1126 RepID=UPI00130C096E|nr:hypothetical protein [Microcystis aeruginosa]MCZ8053603.1 hypothetical protein [Microcystis sp. LE19-12.2C]GCL56143.1 hypothetical protein NIES3806_35020 [Microcystis aeruginosa NIES-3806]
MTKINDLIKENEERVQILSTESNTTLGQIKGLRGSVADFKLRLMAVVQQSQEIGANLQEQINEAQVTLESYFQVTFDNLAHFQTQLAQVEQQAETVTNHWQNQILAIAQVQKILEQTFQQQILSFRGEIGLFTEKGQLLQDKVKEHQSNSLASLQGLYELAQSIQARLNEKQENYDNSYQQFLKNLRIDMDGTLEDFQPLVAEVKEEIEYLSIDLEEVSENLETFFSERTNDQLNAVLSQALASLEQNISQLQEKSDDGFQNLEQYLGQGEEQASSIEQSIKQINQTLAHCRDDLSSIL